MRDEDVAAPWLDTGEPLRIADSASSRSARCTSASVIDWTSRLLSRRLESVVRSGEVADTPYSPGSSPQIRYRPRSSVTWLDAKGAACSVGSPVRSETARLNARTVAFGTGCP